MKLIYSLFLLMTLSGAARASQKIILDTDSNFFADDCLALGMLLHYPQEFELQALTIVSGTQYPRQGYEYLAHIIKMFNKTDLPVYLGSDLPLVNNTQMVEKMKKEWGLGFAGAFDLPLPDEKNLKSPYGGKFSGLKPHSEDAVSYLIRTLSQSPQALSIIAIGPLTNIAKVIKSHPELVSKIKELIFMGGNIRVDGNVTKSAEFNFWFDPEAAQIVLRSNITRKVMIPLDLTNQAAFRYNNFKEVAAIKTPLAKIFSYELAESWPGFKAHPQVTHYIWDAIIPIYLLDKSIIESEEEMYLDVETVFGPRYGSVKVTDKKTSNTPVVVLTKLNYLKFYHKFISILKKPMAL